MMKNKIQILDRYFFSEFLRNFFGVLFALILIAQVTKITESLAPVLGFRGPRSTIFYFYLLYIPVYITLISAPALLFAVSVSTAKFFNSNEMAVIFSGGRSLLRVLTPVILFSVVVTIFLFFFSEWITYPATYQANRIWRTFAWADYNPKAQNKDKLLVRSGNRFYTISHFSIHEKKAEGVHLIELSTNYTPVKIYDFDKAEIVNGHWYFFEGTLTRFKEDGNFLDSDYYKEYRSNVDDPPEYFWDEGNRFEEKNVFDLLHEMKIKHARGEMTREHLIEFYWHFSFPVVAVVLTIIGSLLGKHLKRGAIAISFAVTTVVSVVYFLIMFFGKSMGVSGLLPPFVAAWFANIVFAAVILYLFYREHRYN